MENDILYDISFGEGNCDKMRIRQLKKMESFLCMNS